MENAARRKNTFNKSTLVIPASGSVGSRDEDRFYPKTPETPSTDEERQITEQRAVEHKF
jgi:hypothetical protein